ncbi:uncharacterized protein LOC134210266 [Armigeres subalbatus]|uniref:uncharacterized protein LOC134210266 n=1 Tax=Armigeres subalbatus TaxID=124917 RepID=UPI002ED58285
MSSFDAQQLNFPDGLELADPTFNVPGPVNILIGSGLCFKLLKHGQLDLEDYLPAVQKTHLGWLVSGVVPTTHTNVGRALCMMVTEDDVGKLLQRFWHFDSYDDCVAREGSSDDICVSHFMETYKRNEDGRYVVRLPFNDLKTQIGESRSMAEKRFLAVERRLDRDPLLKAQYAAFIREYEELGHMVEVIPEADEDASDTFYLPHHCVLKPSTTTTKLRVVFDGSAESSSGVSINQAMMVGPTVQNDFISILLQFRSHRYAISADIPKMYRQVYVHNDDTSFQRIVWRENRDQPLKTYALQTVTYGLASSPFLATMALRQLAEDDGAKFPLAAEAVKKTFYIDDMLTGADTLEESADLLRQVLGLLKAGGFNAHKICSNSNELVKMAVR